MQLFCEDLEFLGFNLSRVRKKQAYLEKKNGWKTTARGIDMKKPGRK